MLRHSTSLLVSVMMHVAVLVGVAALYQMYRSVAVEPQEHRVCLCLTQVAEAVPSPVPVVTKQVHERITEEVPLSKPIPLKPPTPPQVKPSPIVQHVPKKQPVAVPKEVKKRLEQPQQKIKPEPRLEEPDVQSVTAVPKRVEPVALEREHQYSQPPTTPTVAPPSVAVEEPVQPSVQERYLDEHLQIISQLLRRHLYYPKRARKRHMEGNVIVVFELLQNGDIGNIHVKQSSNKGILDRAAVKTISKLSGKVPKPPQTITIEIPIQFRLRS